MKINLCSRHKIPFCSALSLILIFALAGGCEIEHGQQFAGNVWYSRVESSTRREKLHVYSIYDIRHNTTGLLGFQIQDLGVVVIIYDRFGASDTRLSGKHIDNCYLIAADEIRDMNFDEFLDQEPESRLRNRNVFPFHGSFKITKWNGENDFQIHVDAAASDPNETKLLGDLSTYLFLDSYYDFDPRKQIF